MTRDEMLSYLDSKAGIVRSKYLTIAPGQEATYYLKAENAKAYATAGYTGDVPPMVQSEADATGVSTTVACQTLMATLAAWTQMAAAIEYYRIKGKIDLEAAETDEDAEVLLHGILESLNGLMP